MANNSNVGRLATQSEGGVGVVIPVYNRRTLLIEALAQVLKQELPPGRLVIVDDGSTDGSADAAEQWLAERRPPFEWRVLRGPNRGASTARNEGFKLVADLPLVAFLDSDDHWPADFLRRTTGALAARPEAVAVTADRLFEEAGVVSRQATDCSGLMPDPIPWFFQRGAGVVSCTVLRSKAVAAAGGWPPELVTAEDAWLFTHVAFGGPWLHTPGAPVTIHLGSGAARDESANLSRSQPGYEAEWADVFERLYAVVCQGRSERDVRRLRLELARRWQRGGKQHLRAGDPAAARACFQRSVSWAPLQVKAWGRLAVAALRQRAA